MGPVLLIAVGAIFLLGNMGILGANTWQVLFQLWPIALIAVGLDLLVGRRSLVWSVVIVLVVAGLIIAALTLTNLPGSQFRPTGYPAAQSESVSQPLDGAKRANVEIAFGPGAVQIGALSDSDKLLEGTVGTLDGVQLTQTFHVSGDTATYRLGTRMPGPEAFFPPRFSSSAPSWDLRLNQDVPMALKLNGVGTSELDLSRLQITSLDANLGVGTTTITLPAEGQVQASVSVGVGETTITVPQGMAARVQVDSGIGGLKVPPTYRRDNNVYTSPDYDTSRNRMDLKVRGGVGKVSIQ